MIKKSIKVLLLVEDNPGDVRLLGEMFHEQGSHHMELVLADFPINSDLRGIRYF